jgi:hypothetical protein
MGASGLKKTPVLKGNGPRFLSHENLLLTLRGFQLRNSIEQNPGVRMQRPAEEIFPIRHLHHLSHIHDCNSITDMFDDAKVMGDEEVGETQLVSKIHQEVEDLSLDRDI